MKTRKTVRALLIVLLMTFGWGASAMTITNEDLKHPTVPWKNYTVTMMLCTDDKKQVRYDEANISVTLASAANKADIAFSDIKDYGTTFFLKDKTGAEYPAISCLVRGGHIENGKVIIDEVHKEFDLLFKLPEGSWDENLSLVIGNKDMKERPIIKILP